MEARGNSFLLTDNTDAGRRGHGEKFAALRTGESSRLGTLQAADAEYAAETLRTTTEKIRPAWPVRLRYLIAG